jgi:dimethylargininase
MTTLAITRHVSPRLAECELTCIDASPIDLERAQAQHAAYVRVLRDLGCEVVELPAEPDLPDSVFVEDTAVVLPEVAIITRPGADSRKPETASVAAALAPYRDLHFIEAPATLDGGDVLVMGTEIYVGLSTRSDTRAVEQLRGLLGPFGYTVTGVPLRGCLHLKSAVTRVGEDTVLINTDWADAAQLGAFERIPVDPAEPHAANGLPVNGRVVFPQAFPRTRERLERHGCAVVGVALDELAKAEGAVTCCSLVFEKETL